MVKVYEHFLFNGDFESGDYNAGFENISIKDIANFINSKYGAEIEYLPSNDPRSYRQDSTKLIKTGFLPGKKVADAISDVWGKLESKTLVDDDRWYTIKTMKKLGLG
jgi:nucleoside-diphosphate-sugar epimerase